MLEALQHHQERFGTKQSIDLLVMLDKQEEANQVPTMQAIEETVKGQESIHMLGKSRLKVSSISISKDTDHSMVIRHNQAINSNKAIHSNKDTLNSKASHVLKDHLTGYLKAESQFVIY